MNFAKPIQRLLKPIALTSMLIALAACGGGGGDDSSATVPVNPPPSGDTAKVSGSVAGTTIIALNSSGDIVAIDDNAEKDSDIDSDGDGTLDAFSFALTGIPLTQDIRVFLVIGSGIYPVYFDTNNDGVSDSNVFALASGSTGLALGFIEINGESGRGIPSNNPVDDNDVTSKGAIAAIPSNINKPPTGGLTFAQLNAKGKNALASGWVLGARAYYLAAEKLAANNAGNDADTARFMLALTRVAALEYDTLSDANAQDMDRLGDLLDLFAFANNETRANWDLIQNPTTLPDDSPTGNDLRNFSYDVVRPELQAAAANLDQVSGSFDAVFTHDGEVLNADHGDALFFSGLFRSIIASIEILRAYDFNVDIDAVQNNEESDPTAEEILASNSTLLGRPDLKKLAEAKGSLSTALSRLKSAIDSINAESDDQTDDFITLDETIDSAEIKTWIDETQSSIDGGSTNIRSASVDLQSFFNNGVVLDDTTLPSVNGNDFSDFPDPTFGGIILDADIEKSGIQDIN